MNDTQYAEFYEWETKVGGSYPFGYVFRFVLRSNYEKFDCVDEDLADSQYNYNCSADYLAAIQWGGSKVTNSTFIDNDGGIYFPRSLSVEGWNIPGIVGKPEYYAWSTE